MSRRRGRPMGDGHFYDDWMKKGIQPQDLSKNTIKHDKWDRQDYERLLKEMQELAASEDKITDEIPTGGTLFEDLYFSLSKAEPKIEDPGAVRPSHLINRAVMGEATELNEWDELREYSIGDEIGSALACIAMEPDMETLYDRLKQEQKMAEKLAEQEQQAEDLQKTAEELWEELQNNPDDKQAQKDYNKNQELLNKLREMIAQGAEALQDALNKQGPAIAAKVRSALNKGMNELGETEASAQSWGLDRGTLQRMDPKERIELAKRLNNPRLKRIAELIGPMSRLAFAEQMRKTTHAYDEIYDLTLGNDLDRVIPSELMTLRQPILKWDFYRKFSEGQLMQYELRGEERVAKGGLIVCEDGSGSMSGDREMWSKAVSLCLLHIARAQQRSFYGIHFGGPHEIFVKDFRNPKEIDFEGTMEWAEVFFGGGTDFMTPLTAALAALQEEFKEKGAVNGDIVFITDGACGVPSEWLEEFKKEQKRIGFRVFGIVIGGSSRDEPLFSIADGRVLTIKDLTSGEDLRDVFRVL